MLERSGKQIIVEDLAQRMDRANAIFLTNLIGIQSNVANDLREHLREVDGDILVSRNTFFKKAGEGRVVSAILENLKGPHALAFAYSDPSAVAKCLKKARKENEVILLGGGVLGESVLLPQEVDRLADLPSKKDMIGILLATFNAPLSALVRVLDGIKLQKESDSE